MEKWQKNEIKKEYLNGYRYAKRKEQRTLEEIQQLRANKMFPCLQCTEVKGSSQTDLSDYAAKLDELIEELKQERVESIDKYTNIRKSILYIKNDDEQEVLERRYLLSQTWEEIAESMNYSRRYVLKIHGRALHNFQYQKEDTKRHTKI